MDRNEIQVRNMIGALAFSIRCDWYDIKSRLYAIIELCKSINRNDWVQEIEDDMSSIYADGRWFRSWSGPYDTSCDINSVGEELYNTYSHLVEDD